MNNPIKLTHANWTNDDGSPVAVYVYPQQVFSVFFMPQNKATAVVSTGAGHVLVLESEEEINLAITASNKEGVK